MDNSELRQIIRESLVLIAENQAFAPLYDKIDDIDAGFIDVNQKRFDNLKKKEAQARSKEEFSELRDIKKDQLGALAKLIAAYKKKVDYLKQIRDGIKDETMSIANEGSGVFNNREIEDFDTEEFNKGDKIEFHSISSKVKAYKMADYNAYKIIDTDAQGIKVGDVMKLPKFSVGRNAKIALYRSSDGGRFEEVGSPTFKTITKIIKNPS